MCSYVKEQGYIKVYYYICIICHGGGGGGAFFFLGMYMWWSLCPFTRMPGGSYCQQFRSYFVFQLVLFR